MLFLRTFGAFFWLLVIVIGLAILSRGISMAIEPAPKPRDHYYTFHEGNQYGYPVGLSDDDTRAGQVGKPLLVFTADGTYDPNRLTLTSHLDGGGMAELSCTVPCATVRIRTIEPFRGSNDKLLQPVKGSVVWAVTQDLVAGKLIPAE